MHYECPATAATGPGGELVCLDDMLAPVTWVGVEDSAEGFWDSSLTLEDVSTLLAAIVLTFALAYGFRMLSRLIWNSRG